MARLSLGGELMRYGLAEWSGAAMLQHAARDLAGQDESALPAWIAEHSAEGEDDVKSLPVVICDRLATVGQALNELSTEGASGAIVIGSMHPTATPLWFGKNGTVNWLLSEALSQTPAERIAWLGMPSQSVGDSRLAVAMRARALTPSAMLSGVQAAKMALMLDQHCIDLWLIVCLDSLVPIGNDADYRLSAEAVASALSWFAAGPMARGIFLVSSPTTSPTGAPPDIVPGMLARQLGQALGARSAGRRGKRPR